MINVFQFVTDWGWRIRLGKIPPIPRDGAACIVFGPRCTIESLCSKLVCGCRKGGYGCREDIGHCQPKTHTLECVLVQVGSWVLHVVVHLHNMVMVIPIIQLGLTYNTQRLFNKRNALHPYKCSPNTLTNPSSYLLSKLWSPPQLS